MFAVCSDSLQKRVCREKIWTVEELQQGTTEENSKYMRAKCLFFAPKCIDIGPDLLSYLKIQP